MKKISFVITAIFILSVLGLGISAAPAYADSFWAKTNTHMHTTNSDGTSTPEQVVNAYKSAGYNVIALTDHGKITPCASYTALEDKFLCLNSCEFAGTYGGHTGHLPSINVQTVPSGDFQSAVNSVVSQGGFGIVAHPGDGATLWTVDQLAQLQNYTALEILNGKRSGDRVPWDDVLLRGKKAFGVGGDDMHVLATQMGTVWNKVYMPEFTQDAYLSSVKSGQMYVTQGPTMDNQPFALTCDDFLPAHMGKTTSSYGIKATAVITPTPGTYGISSISLIKDGVSIVTKTDCPNGDCAFTYEEPSSGSHYYRLYAVDSANRQLWSNPVWVDNTASNPLVADAGTDQVAHLPFGANLYGSVKQNVTESGASLVSTWTQIQGPGTTTFADEHKPFTTATFSAPGEYTLQLSATYSQYSATDTVHVTVHPVSENISPVGMNLSSMDYWNAEVPFKDLMKQPMGWQLVSETTYTSIPIPADLLDENGWPQYLPANTYLYMGMLQGVKRYHAGTYVCLYEGDGDFTFGNDATNIQKPDPNRNRYTFNCSGKNAPLTMQIHAIRQPIRNIRIVPIEFENDTENPWSPVFLNNMAEFSVIRFMPWMQASAGFPKEVSGKNIRGAAADTVTLAADASDINGYYNGMMLALSGVNWHNTYRMILDYNGTTKEAKVGGAWYVAADSPLPSTQSYSISKFTVKEWANRKTSANMNQTTEQGVALEYMIDLSNRLNASPWFCFPSAVSDDYMRQFALIVRDGCSDPKHPCPPLNPNLKIYIEWANESWNSGYPGYAYGFANGAAIGANSSWNYHPYRAVQMFKIFDEVFGESHLRSERTPGRLVRLLASQNGYLASGTTIMDFNGADASNHVLITPGYDNPFDFDPASGKYHKAADYADALAVTYYIGESITLKDTLTKSVDQLIDMLDAEVDKQMTTGGARFTNIQNARARGLDIVIYEGGTSVVTSVNVADASGIVATSSVDTVQIQDDWFSQILINDQLVGWQISITSGPGINDGWKTITAYDAASRTARLSTSWTEQPTTASKYLVRLWSPGYRGGKVQASSETTIQMADDWSTKNLTPNSLNGRILSIASGPGAGQYRTITGLDIVTDGAGKRTVTITVDEPWTVIPTTASIFHIRLIDHYKADELNRHPRMYALYQKAFQSWKNAGLDANGKGCKVFCDFIYAGGHSQYGRWGKLETYDQDPQTSPKWMGHRNFISNNPRWWDQSAVTLYGDVSGDNKVTGYDAALVAQASVNLITFSTDQTKAADVSGDSEVTGYDAALIAQRAVELIQKFPVE